MSTQIKHIIDCNADPFVPSGWEVVEHIKGGQIEWDPAKVILCLDEAQQNGGAIRGHELLEKLKALKDKDGRLLNANVLDYLLANQRLIPEEWKSQWVHFSGTVYRGALGYRSVRYLLWLGDRWYWDDYRLDDDFDGDGPTAVLTSD